MSEKTGQRWPEWTWVLLLFILSTFAIAPLTLPGYHWSAQDARHSVYFLLQFDRSISDGILYPRWAPDFTFGYGYPFFNIYAPLSSYLGEVFHLLGFDLVTSVEIVFAIGAVASALAMYLWLRLHTKPAAAMLGALVYLYAPYHLVDLYVRASLAEFVALAFLPLCLWAFDRLSQRPSPGRVVAAASSYAGLMLSSNILALLFSPILGGYILVLAWPGSRSRREGSRSRFALLPSLLSLARALAPAALAVGLGLGLSAIFWLPGILEYKYVRTDQWVGGYYEYQNHFVSSFQLFSFNWGFGTSIAGPDDGMSFQLGLAPVALSLLGILSWRQLSHLWRRLWLYLCLATIVVIFLTLGISQPVWRLLGLVSFAQFPWRLFAIILPAMAFLAASLFTSWQEDGQVPALALLWALLIILPVYPYLKADVRPTGAEEATLKGLMRFQQSADEMTGSTAWVQRIPQWSPLADQIMAGIPITTKVDYVDAYSTGKLAVHSMEMGTTHEKVWFQAEDGNQHVRFHTFYYPGWTAYILDENTEQVETTAPIEPEGELGLITVPVPQGRHILLLVFQDTPLRKAGTIITVAGAAIALLLLAVPTVLKRLRWRKST